MDVSLIVDGRTTPPLSVDGDVWQFEVRLPANSIRLRSGAARPADVEGTDDLRMLGVAVASVRWRKGDAVLDLPIERPDFSDGFHHVEMDADGRGPFRWTVGNAGLPRGGLPPWTGRARLQLRLRAWAGTALRAPPSREATVLGAFQALGMDCEFGLAQRAYGVEPLLTLWRWAGTSLDRLLAGLNCRFDGLGDAGATTAFWNGDEYMLRTPFLNMHTGARVQRDAAGVDQLLQAGRVTLRLLRRKLLADVADPLTRFICKCKEPGITEADMWRLHTALHGIGPATLLCVTTTRPGRAGGDVDRLGRGLYAGCVDRFTGPAGPFDQWVTVCANAISLMARPDDA